MKRFHIRILSLALLLTSLAISLLLLKKTFFCHTKSHPLFSLSESRLQLQLKKTVSASSLALTQQVKLGVLQKLPGLNELSAKDRLGFPEAVVVEAAEIDGPEPNEKTRLHIIHTDFICPNIRTEEIIDTTNNSVIMRQEMVADHFLVTLTPREKPEDFLKSMGDKVISMKRVTDSAPLYDVELASYSLEALPSAIATANKLTAGVSEPDFIIHAATIPNNSIFEFQKYLLSPPDEATIDDYEKAYYIDAVDAWDIRTDASSVIVAVLDTGIRYTHHELASNIWVNRSPNRGIGDIHGYNPDTNNGDVMDHNGHGTMCAGLIGAVGNNNSDIYGVTPKVQIMACKLLGDKGISDTRSEIRCIDYAIGNGAKVLNCSFGYTEYSYPYGSSLERDAFKRARNAGVIAVCAAGNEGQDNDNLPHYPASFQLDNIVSVGAIAERGYICNFSNYGVRSVHLCAPGANMLSTYGGPSYHSGYDFIGSDDDMYAIGSGTSFAAPLVTGAFALLIAQFPKEAHNSLIARLLNATNKTPGLEKITTSGGSLNVYAALTKPFKPLPSSISWWEKWWGE